MNKIFVVGIGPGGREQMTGQALAALDEAQVLCGYTKYIELVRPLYPDKEVCQTPLTREKAAEMLQSAKEVLDFRESFW